MCERCWLLKPPLCADNAIICSVVRSPEVICEPQPSSLPQPEPWSPSPIPRATAPALRGWGCGAPASAFEPQHQPQRHSFGALELHLLRSESPNQAWATTRLDHVAVCEQRTLLFIRVLRWNPQSGVFENNAHLFLFVRAPPPPLSPRLQCCASWVARETTKYRREQK